MNFKENINLIADERARELIALIKNRFVTPAGFLSRSYPATPRTLFDNFDDLAPFFLYFGEADFLLNQIRKIIDTNNNIISLCAENGVLVTRAIDEWLGGLFAIWQETRDDAVYGLLKDSVVFIRDNLMVDPDFLSAAFYVGSGKRAGFYEPWSAGLLECFCEMREVFPEMFEKSQMIMRSWLGGRYFQKYHLFPYRVFSRNFLNYLQEYLFSYFLTVRVVKKPVRMFSWENCKNNFGYFLKNTAKSLLFYWQNGWASQLMKSNSTAAFTLLEFYLATKDSFWLENLLRWIDGALEHFCDTDNRVYMLFVPKRNKKIDACVTASFILADVICDTVNFAPLSQEIRSKLLDQTQKILDYAWSTRLENGLLPFVENGKFSQLDNQIDFSVSLRKFGELSGNYEYKNRAAELVLRVLTIHYTQQGYVTYQGDNKRPVVDPKYNALVLKGLINLATMEDKIYPKFYSLFKDR